MSGRKKQYPDLKVKLISLTEIQINFVDKIADERKDSFAKVICSFIDDKMRCKNER